jgi:hypothetical protein
VPVDGIHASGGFAAAPVKKPAKQEDRGFAAALQAETTKRPAAAPRATTTEEAAPTPAAAKAETARPKAPAGERTDPVEGHAYAEIIAGPRNGMFLNTSGNARDGLAFTLVERDGWHFHVYGTGADRKIFRVEDDDPQTSPGGVKPKA